MTNFHLRYISAFLLTLIPDETTVLSTKAVIANAFFDPYGIVPAAPVCSTGNCTWPIVPSLAVCGSCTDVTTKLTSVCLTDSNPSPNCDITLWGSGDNYTFQTANSNPYGTVFKTASFASLEYSNNDTILLDSFYIVDTSNRTGGPVIAHTCGLWFCVQAYRVKVENGTLDQQIVANWSLGQQETTSTYRTFTDVPEQEFNLPDNITFGAGNQAIRGFYTNLVVDFNTEIQWYTGGQLIYEGDTDDAIALYNVSNWNYWIDRFALSLSNNVRLIGTTVSNGSYYDGKAYSVAGIVEVRWIWILFPAAMVAASILFLGASIWQTQRCGAKAWKSDPLALLLASVDEEIGSSDKPGQNIEDEEVLLEFLHSRPRFKKATEDKRD